VNHTRFPKEDHLPDWARRDNKVTKGDRVEYIPRNIFPEDDQRTALYTFPNRNLYSWCRQVQNLNADPLVKKSLFKRRHGEWHRASTHCDKNYHWFLVSWNMQTTPPLTSLAHKPPHVPCMYIAPQNNNKQQFLKSNILNSLQFHHLTEF